MIPKTQYIPEETIKKVWPERFEETKEPEKEKDYHSSFLDLSKYSTTRNKNISSKL
jgi:hypothetical protein